MHMRVAFRLLSLESALFVLFQGAIRKESQIQPTTCLCFIRIWPHPFICILSTVLICFNGRLGQFCSLTENTQSTKQKILNTIWAFKKKVCQPLMIVASRQQIGVFLAADSGYKTQSLSFISLYCFFLFISFFLLNIFVRILQRAWLLPLSPNASY